MKPLVEAEYPQTPTNRDGRGLGFIKQPFHALRNIADWWSNAWTESNAVWRPRFFEEARSSLPLRDGRATEVTLEDVVDGVEVRRALLRQDQRLPEWTQE